MRKRDAAAIRLPPGQGEPVPAPSDIQRVDIFFSSYFSGLLELQSVDQQEPETIRFYHYRPDDFARGRGEGIQSMQELPGIPNGFGDEDAVAKNRDSGAFSTKDVLKTFEDYLSAIEGDENAKGKKE